MTQIPTGNESAQATNSASENDGWTEKSYACLLPAAGEESKRLAAGWLKLAMASLLVSGLFSILLVMARTPMIKDIFPWGDFFYTGMVVHVNLSVLMFFLPCAGIIWNFNSNDRYVFLGRAALYVAALGTAVMVVSAFMGDGKPLMSNYVPVVDGPLFFIGLSLIGFGFSLLVARSLMASAFPGPWSNGAAGLRVGIYAAALAGAVAVCAFLWSYLTIPDAVEGKQYYEVLFWGGGHVLQYIHTLLMLVCWLWLASSCGLRISLTPRVVAVVFCLGVSTVLFVPYNFIMQAVDSVESISNFTLLMRGGGGMAALPFALVIIWSAIFYTPSESSRNPLRTTLIYSMLLFAVGGVFGYMIEGSNTLVTAHYHGSNGAITLAYMGLIYLLLPKLGFSEPKRKLANWQAHAFGTGQLLHVIGLAWAGGYGMQRKVAGSGQSLDNFQQTAGMAVMGIGGLIAVIGGVLFLVVV
ncbi:MAG: cytochrome C oxidase subunit I, partial [Mariprofundaceae bacterium]|nr:cytochrome C oxidase subunit I [Mariprofundaceae bacterium]